MEQKNRKRYGMITGAVGILLNILLFAGKLLAGILSGAVSVTADAFNNLSDAASCVVTVLGFRIANKKPDPDHPYGHGRMEYIAGLIVSILILLMGCELLHTSVVKILSSETQTVEAGTVTIGILSASIAVKLVMFGYNRFFAKKLRSSAMSAASADSLSDAVATSVVLISCLVELAAGYAIDGYAGVLVSGFIFYSGIRSLKDTVDPLLGKAPDAEFVGKIHTIVRSYAQIVGVHDLIVHDYGPGRVMITLHVEVPEDGDMVALHEVIDQCERRLHQELGCFATIHMDPAAVHDTTVLAMKKQLLQKIHAYNPEISIHDFRVIHGADCTELVFDAVLPMKTKIPSEEVKKRLEEIVAGMPGNCRARIDLDLQYAKWQEEEADQLS